MTSPRTAARSVGLLFATLVGALVLATVSGVAQERATQQARIEGDVLLPFYGRRDASPAVRVESFSIDVTPAAGSCAPQRRPAPGRGPMTIASTPAEDAWLRRFANMPAGYRRMAWGRLRWFACGARGTVFAP